MKPGLTNRMLLVSALWTQIGLEHVQTAIGGTLGTWGLIIGALALVYGRCFDIGKKSESQDIEETAPAEPTASCSSGSTRTEESSQVREQLTCLQDRYDTMAADMETLRMELLANRRTERVRVRRVRAAKRSTATSEATSADPQA